MNEKEHYHPVAKILHWMVVVLVAIQFISAWIVPGFFRGLEAGSTLNIHMSFGLIVLPIAALLLFMCFFRPVEKQEREELTLQSKAALAMHYLLYILLILLPFNGWVYASAWGLTVNIFGLFDMPSLVAAGSVLGRSFGGMHEFFATVIGILVLGHFGAALYHHVILKDNVLWRMLPKALHPKTLQRVTIEHNDREYEYKERHNETQ